MPNAPRKGSLEVIAEARNRRLAISPCIVVIFLAMDALERKEPGLRGNWLSRW
jgi:hypothetical protein